MVGAPRDPNPNAQPQPPTNPSPHPHPEQGDVKSGRIARADVAAIAVESLASGASFDTTFECYDGDTAKVPSPSPDLFLALFLTLNLAPNYKP